MMDASLWRFRLFCFRDTSWDSHHVMLGIGQPWTVQENLTSMPAHTVCGRSGTGKSGAFMLKSSRNFMCTEAFLSACVLKWRMKNNKQLLDVFPQHKNDLHFSVIFSISVFINILNQFLFLDFLKIFNINIFFSF